MSIGQKPNLTHWKFYVWWITANTVGWALVDGITTFIIVTTYNYWLDNIIQTGTGTAITIILVAITAILTFSLAGGTIIWLLQWLSLRRQHIPKNRHWVFFSFIGWIVGLIVGGQVATFLMAIAAQFLSYITSANGIKSRQISALVPIDVGIVMSLIIFMIFSAVIGAIIGVMQHFILSRYTALARWWMLVNAVAMPLALFIVVVFAQLLTLMQAENAWYRIWGIYGGLFGIVFGAITGVALLWFLHNPRTEMQMVLDWLKV